MNLRFSGVSDQLFALVSLMAALSPAIAAPVLQPPGLKPGDTYHLAFVTEYSLPAINTASGTEKGDSFVGWSAQMAGIDQGPSGAIEWRGLTSTPHLDARDHLNISAPVYLLDGTKIADGAAELWSTGPSSPISINEFGVRHSAQHWQTIVPGYPEEVTMVWSGSRPDGTYREEIANYFPDNSQNEVGNQIGNLPTRVRPCTDPEADTFLGNALGGNWLLEPGYPHLFPNEPCSTARITEIHDAMRREITAPDGGFDVTNNTLTHLGRTAIIDDGFFNIVPASLYGFSVMLTVPVPEPSTTTLTLTLVAGCLTARGWRRQS